MLHTTDRYILTLHFDLTVSSLFSCSRSPISRCHATQSWSAHDAARGGVLGVAFRPDDLSVLSAGGDGRVLEWSMRNGNQLMVEYSSSSGSGSEVDGVATEQGSPSRERSLNRIDLQFGGDERSFVVGPLLHDGGRSAGIFVTGTAAAINVLRNRESSRSGGRGLVSSAAWHPSVDCVAVAVDEVVHLRWLVPENTSRAL